MNTFLVSLDGVNVLKNTYVIGATSRPDMIDPAILRPGRIDCHIFCDIPNSEERKNYFEKKL